MASIVECLPVTCLGEAAASRKRSRHEEEAALVRRAQAGDQMAFREIVERYQARVFSVIHRMLRDRAEAEDIAQEVFASAFLSIHGYKSEGSLFSWLYRITVNECYEHLRRKRVRPLVYEGDFKDEDAPALNGKSSARPVDATLADRDLAIKLLSRLSETDRCLLLMKEVEGYSVEELSEMTGINANSVKVKLFRARRKLVKAAGKDARTAAAAV